MELIVKIKNRVATYQEQGDVLPICGNTDDVVRFEFDDEWGDHDKKTARFIWGGKHKDVEFTGDTCEVPVVTNTQVLLVGVYAGELPADGFMLSTTNASIKYQLSTRCVGTTPNPSSGQNYTNEARGYAEEAKAAAKSGFKVVGTFETECCDENGVQTFLGEPYEWHQKYNDEGAGGKWFMIDSSNALVEESLVYNIKANYDDQNPLDELFRTSTFVVLNIIGISASYGDRDEDYKEVTGGLIPLHIWENFQIGRFDDILPIVEERIGNPLHSCLVEVRDYEWNSHHCLYLSDFVTSTLALGQGDGIQLSLRFTGYSDRVEEE